MMFDRMRRRWRNRFRVPEKYRCVYLGNDVLILAIHGGRLEPGTSVLAREIMDLGGYSGYVVDWPNGRRHIPSDAILDDALDAQLARAQYVVSIHGCRGRIPGAVVGGVDWELRNAIRIRINLAGFSTRNAVRYPALDGMNRLNVCNMGVTGEGVQLEISRGQRDDLLAGDLLMQRYAAAIHQGIEAVRAGGAT
ncbi:MAG: poly-gamma-glutamate hydrolase family protein [Verrucomicrobiota bacterium]